MDFNPLAENDTKVMVLAAEAALENNNIKTLKY